jgi:hypothetical protein
VRLRQGVRIYTLLQGRVQEIKTNCYRLKKKAFTRMDSAVGTDMGRSGYDDWDDDDDDYGDGGDDGDGDISFDSSDDEAIIYRMKLAEEKRNKKKKRKTIGKETEYQKRPRKLYVAATMAAAATHTKSNNGDEEERDDDDDDDDDYNNNFNVSPSSRKRREITKSKQQTKWMRMYHLLIAYKKEHNTTKVPRNYDKLGEWVALQRKLSNNNSLLDGRYTLLDCIHFDWGKGPRPQTGWIDMYQKLVAYKKKHYTTNVPKNSGSLGLWVHLQRNLDSKNMLLDERYSLLDSINFNWGNGPRPRAHWLYMYKRLVEYKKEHNNTNVPQKYDLDIKLGLWVMRQRNTYNSNKLLDEYTSLLDSIGFVWSLRRGNRTTTSAIPLPTRRKKLYAPEDAVSVTTTERTFITIAVPTAVCSSSSGHSISSSVFASSSPFGGPILNDVGSNDDDNDDNNNNNNNNMQDEDIVDDYHHPYASLYAMATASGEYLPTV